MALPQLLVLTSLIILGAFSNDFPYLELTRYEYGVKVVFEHLFEEGCLNKTATGMMKRNLVSTDRSDIKLEMNRKLYERLIDQLAECRKKRLEKNVALLTTKIPTTTTSTSTSTSTTTTTTPTTTTPTTTTPTITTPTTTITTATQIPVPAECRRAINLTESWRMEHKGGLIKPKNGSWNCDTRDMVSSGRPWFRFSGAAGNRLLNKCVPVYSCGTYVALWSDDPTPTSIGVISQITAYGNDYTEISHRCRLYKQKINIMRCSNKAHDFVYRLVDSVGCPLGFCGMSA